MKYFKVLPTNPDFMNLTDAQLLLLEAHIDIDYEMMEKQLKKKSSAQDSGYDEEEPERYDDPNFDKAWEELDVGDEEAPDDYVPEAWEEID